MESLAIFLFIAIAALVVAALINYLVIEKLPLGEAKLWIQALIWLLAIIVIIWRFPGL